MTDAYAGPPSARRLAGKVAIVTGSTQGLGEAIARRFACEGAAGIVVTGRNAERGEAVRQSLASGSARAVFVAADLADPQSAARIVGEADRAFGRVDVLVNAAACTDRGTIVDTPLELFDRMMAINLRTPFFLIQEAAKVMRREKIAGSIVNIQSVSAHGGQPFLAAYSVSKGALVTLTKNAAFSLMLDRIRVNGLNLGWMNTPGEDAVMRKFHGAQDGWLAEAARRQPYGRLVEPEEAARLCAFVASEESGLMSGASIDFDQSVLGCCESTPQPSAPV